MSIQHPILSLGLLFALGGCATGSSPKLLPSAAITHKVAQASGEVLYVGNSGGVGVPATITAYAPGSVQILRTIDSPQGASQIAFDPSGNLYVGLGCSVAVYAPDAITPYRTISKGIASANALAVDSIGTLYVENVGGGRHGSGCSAPGHLSEYAPGASTPDLTIHVPHPGSHHLTAIALDSRNHAYVVNVGKIHDRSFVVEYASRSARQIRTIPNRYHLHTSIFIALDGSRNFYRGFGPPRNVIQIYAPAARTPQMTIKLSAQCEGFVVDAHDGTVYVLERSDSTSGMAAYFVAVFRPRASKPSRMITSELESPSILALDNAGNLYVANLGTSDNHGVYKNPSVVEYAKGGSKPTRKITDGIVAPAALAFSSQ